MSSRRALCTYRPQRGCRDCTLSPPQGRSAGQRRAPLALVRGAGRGARLRHPLGRRRLDWRALVGPPGAR
eukprot:14102434-Alexandrium_andersonii.AAC.1